MWKRILPISCAAILILAAVTHADNPRRKDRRNDRDRTRRSTGRDDRGSRRNRASGGSVRFDPRRADRNRARRSGSKGVRRTGRDDRRTRDSRRNNADGRNRGTRNTPRTRQGNGVGRNNDGRRNNGIRGNNGARRNNDIRGNRRHASRGSIRHHRPAQRNRFGNGRFNGFNRNIRVRNYPRFGTTIGQLPLGFQRLNFGRRDYFLADGIYYRGFGNGRFRVVRPPIGARFGFLPAGFVNVFIGGQPFYRFNDVYYTQQFVNNDPVYVVVQPPIETYLDELPFDTREAFWRGQRYLVDIHEEIAYLPVIVDGYTQYRRTDIDVDVDFDDGRIEIEFDD